ncbi:MAG: DNA repair protein [Clostridiales bacterium]|nr:DNA repair protein [Clostridiales bacterium]
MTDKELKRLSRSELLEMLIIQMEENEELKKKLAETEKALVDRRIEVAQAGTLAEAALRLNGIFEAADRAAAQYLENIRSRAEERTDVHEQCGS